MQRAQIIKSLIPLVEELKKNPNLELEGSLGVWGEDRFTSGVNFSHFKALYSAFNSAPKQTDTNNPWTAVGGKRHFASFLYKDKVRGRYNVKDKPVFVRKTALAKCDISCEGRPYDLRVSLKSEEPVEVYLAKDKPELVRLQERWSFTYKSSWKYDFTKVASGSSKELACKSQPVFEVELELLQNSQALCSLSSDQIAEHILEKLTDLLGRFDADHKPLPFKLSLFKTWTSQKDVIGNH